MIRPKLHIKSSSFRMLLVSFCIVLVLLVTDYHLADTGRSRYFNSGNFPYGIRPVSLNDKVKLFVDSSDIILAGNFLENKRCYGVKKEHKIESILEYAHNKDSLIVKYIDDNNNNRYMLLEKIGDTVVFREIDNGHSLFEKTKLKKDSFRYTTDDSSFNIVALLHFVIYIIIFIYLVLVLLKCREVVSYLIIYCIILIILYLYIDYKGGLNGANISTYHILHPKSVIEIDFKETPIQSTSENPIKAPNIFFNTTIDSYYIFSFCFLENGVIAQYYDNEIHDIRYAHLQSYPLIDNGIERDWEMITEDIIISLLCGKYYDIEDFKPIEIDEVTQQLATKHKTLWINLRDIYCVWFFRNLSKFVLKILLLTALLFFIRCFRKKRAYGCCWGR